MPMRKVVSAAVFEACCLRMIDQVDRTGEPLLVTKDGKPFVRVMPARFSRKSAFGAMKGSTIILGDIIAPGDDW
jgi:antitoxin (DNA-binding transcriptional repressor) of toxin-antitoxin stability system